MSFAWDLKEATQSTLQFTRLDEWYELKSDVVRVLFPSGGNGGGNAGCFGCFGGGGAKSSNQNGDNKNNGDQLPAPPPLFYGDTRTRTAILDLFKPTPDLGSYEIIDEELPEDDIEGRFGSEVGIEKFRKNLIGISLEFHENFEETACISDVDCIQ